MPNIRPVTIGGVLLIFCSQQRKTATMAASGRQVAALILLQVLCFANAGTRLDIWPSGEIQEKSIGSSIRLTCKPNVDQPNLISNIQWLDPQNRPIEPFSTYSGTTKPPMYTEIHQGNGLALFFNSLQEEQAGTYTCRAQYANSEELSRNVTIETIVGITWENAPTEQHPILGEDARVICKVRARPSPTVDWLYNGELITTNDHYIIETDALRIKNVQESDDGIYLCRASVTTTGELDTRTIRVEGHTRPHIPELESPVEIIEGENANIACKAIGKPPPKFSWVKSLTQQNLATADRFGVEEYTGVLTITNVNRDDAGEYQCIATNAAGQAKSDILVSVIVKPKIMSFLNVTSVVSRQANMTCKAFGRPPPVVTFRKHTLEKPFANGRQPNEDRIILETTQDGTNGETTAVLSIENLMRTDDGLYECMAQNKGGDAFKNGHLTVEFPPSFAMMPNITVWSWEERPVNLTCIAESIPNATIRWQLGGFDIDNDPQITKIGDGPVSTLTVRPLDRRYYAKYKCIASNIHGTRDYFIELSEAYRPRELLKANIKVMTATTITFDLIALSEQLGVPVETITVQYKQTDHTWANAPNKTWAVGSPYILENLMPETTYDFRFSARNKVGQGSWGNNLHESTPRRSAPSQPKMLSNMAPGSAYDQSPYNNQYELRWTIPADNGEPIDLYSIRYCKLNRVSGEWEVQENTCQTIEIKSQTRSNQWLKDLTADTFYRAELRVRNARGLSMPGELKFKTKAGPMAEVTHHEGRLISSGAIIGIVLAIIFILIVIVDLICCCANKTGIIFYICERSRRKPVDDDDSKLGRDEKEPLREEKKITPIIDSGLRRETSVNFNGKTSVSKTGFIGKDSAV